MKKSITWSKSCQSLRSLESWNRCTCSSCSWLPFLIGQVCSQVWCRPYFWANFGFFELRTFPWSPSKGLSRHILPLHSQSRFQVHLHYTWSCSMKSTIVGRDHCYSSERRYSCDLMVSLTLITWLNVKSSFSFSVGVFFIISTVTAVEVNFECRIILTWVPTYIWRV